MRQAARAAGLAVAVFSLACSFGCGYALAGRGSFLPDSIKIIAIPTFTNRTPVFNLETQVTEKVRTEFIGRGRYQIVPEVGNVDAVLTGELTSVTVQPVSVSANQLASRYAITMSAKVELRDVRANKVLWESPGVVFREEFDAQSGQETLDPAAFFGQDANALNRMTEEFARSIVSAILEAF